MERAEGAGPPPLGAQASGSWRRAGTCGLGAAAPLPRAAGGGRILRARPLPSGTREGGCHPAGPELGWPPALPGSLEEGFRRLLTRTLRGRRSRLCRPWVSGNRFCCCVILYQPLLSLLPAAPFFLRPFV